MIEATPPAAAMVTRTVRATDGTRPIRDLCRNATTGLKTNVRMRANASGIRISRAKYSAATVTNSVTIAQLLELGRRRWEALMAGGTGASRKSTALAAGLVPGRLWKNGRFQNNAMLEALGAFTPRERPELFDSTPGRGRRASPVGSRIPNLSYEGCRAMGCSSMRRSQRFGSSF